MAETTSPHDRLLALWGEIRDLEAAEELLEWDQETNLPERGVGARGNTLATLAALKHRKLVSPELRQAVAAAAVAAEPGSLEEAQAREARRRVEQAVRVPEALAAELAAVKTVALSSWQKARAVADFSLFRDDLARLLDLKRREATCLAASDSGPGGRPYDALLDFFEPGATEADLAPLFTALRGQLAPLVRSVLEGGKKIDESPVLGHFPAAEQERLVRRLAAAVGFDFGAGRLDTSTHPFCVGIHSTDVRMTSRYDEEDFRSGLFGVLHETGHGLYEQGLPASLRRSPVGAAASTGLHESQSRLWENHVGRSRAFWQWALPHLHEILPETRGVTVAALWPTLHVVRPSLIRVEADEATYNLHIAVRFEIEREIFAGTLEVDDLPERWDDLYEEMLGIRAESAADGVLQDIHWALGAFGYFPTYTVGTLAAAQLFAAAGKELGDLDPGLAAGDFAPLLTWLREKVHRHGSRYPAMRVIEDATGKPLGPEAFLAHLRGVTAEAYR